MSYRKRILQILVFSLVVATMAAFAYEFHFTDDCVDGVLVWNSKEAYIFSTWSCMGYRSTTVDAFFSLVPAFFGVSRPPDDTRQFTRVFHITPAGIESYVEPDTAFQSYIPKDQTIYVWNGGPLWKWAGNHFEPATRDEQLQIIETPKVTLLSSARDFSNQSGWSVRNSFTAWPAKSEIELSGNPIVFFMTFQDLNKEVSLDVQFPGAARERILHSKSFHYVSNEEYQNQFGVNTP